MHVDDTTYVYTLYLLYWPSATGPIANHVANWPQEFEKILDNWPANCMLAREQDFKKIIDNWPGNWPANWPPNWPTNKISKR